MIEVRLPEEVRGVRAREIAAGEAERLRGAVNLEEADFLGKRALREAMHAREGGCCFYCLRRVTAATRCIIPRVRMGRNGYRNLVSSCAECKSRKGERRAEDFLQWRGAFGEQRTQGAAASAGEDGVRQDAACSE